MKLFRVLFISFFALLLLSPRAFSQATISQILSNGPTANRLNVVFLSEGYTTNQLGQFTNDAKTVLNHMLVTPPFNAYPDYFNAFAISVASVESGADHPLNSLYRNTYFNSTYNSYQIERLLTIPPNDLDGNYADGQGKVDSLLAALMPEHDLTVMIVNDTEYGGSGGSTLVTSMNSSSAEIAVHEMGHTYGHLTDEYSTAFPGWTPVEIYPNATHTNVPPIKWQAWIPNGTPLPTPDTFTYYSVVGLFEGAEYQTTGWYRPKHDCKMNHLNVPYCEICAEALMKSVYNSIRPIDSISPPTNAVITLANTQSVTLSVVSLQPSGYNLSVQWFTNNGVIAGATNASLTLATAALPFGTNQIRVEVTDPTSVVRTDPAQLLKDSRTWQVRVLSPRLDSQRVQDKIILSWLTNASGFTLYYKTNLAAATPWQGAGSAVVISNRFTVTNSITGKAKFYQLR